MIVYFRGPLTALIGTDETSFQLYTVSALDELSTVKGCIVKSSSARSGLDFYLTSLYHVISFLNTMPSSSSSLRVALAQTCPVSAPEGHNSSSRPFEVVERNLRDAEEWVIRASRDGADVVVFPEYFLQGVVDQGRQVSTFFAHCEGMDE